MRYRRGRRSFSRGRRRSYGRRARGRRVGRRVLRIGHRM